MTNKIIKKNILNVSSIVEEYLGRPDYHKIYKFACSVKTDSNRILAQLVRRKFNSDERSLEKMKDKPLELFGTLGDHIPTNAHEQMKKVMEMPPVVKGAMLPDAHLGYSMPIGGVAALSNAIAPALVGYDIGCRVMLTILDMPPEELMPNQTHFYMSLAKSVHFGVDHGFKNTQDNLVFHNPLWKELTVLRDVRDLAIEQLGTSGRGNHFADIVIGDKTTSHPDFDYIPDKFVALMTHSGSRGTGYKLAKYYMALADGTVARTEKMPVGYGWLDLNKDSGREYWKIIQLMDDYSLANHKYIQEKFLNAINTTIKGVFSNAHNLAWIEDGLVIHRKGATPAHEKVVGIIPGSSGSSSYLAFGLGNADSMNSSSHGAGRKFSRTEAKEKFDFEEFEKTMRRKEIMTNLIGTDETYQAYKDIEDVIRVQEGTLIETIAIMDPKIVIMEDPGLGKKERKLLKGG